MINFRALEDEIITQAFEQAWQTDISEHDGARTYAVTEVRKLFESTGIEWRRVARLSATALDHVNTELINGEEL